MAQRVGRSPTNRIVRTLIAVVCGVGVGLVAALVLTVIDLYLAGHGYRPLGAPFIDGPGVHLSLADIMFLASIALGAGVAWRVSGRGAG